jgi:predicted branched-subunit amino acid permease
VETTLAPASVQSTQSTRLALRGPLGRDVFGIAAPAGAFALSFGALATSSGFSVAQTCVLSLLMFTGGSQFALVSAVASGSAALPATAVAVLLGARNALYGLRLSGLLRVSGLRRLAAAQLVIDESSAMATAQRDPASGRIAFRATGLAIFVLWNAGTLIGAIAGRALPDPSALGLDAAAPAAFLALLAPRVRTRDTRVTALTAALVTLALITFAPIGVPVVAAALVAVAVGMRTSTRRTGRTDVAGR